MAIPYENQTNITKHKEVTQKPQTTENTTKSPKNFYKDYMDKLKTVIYNNSKESNSLSDIYVHGTLLSQDWKEKNKDSMRYAGDSAKKSIEAGLKEAPDFMKDADEGTRFEDVQSASVKLKLANDSNNTGLARKATMELIGHLSKENKGPYLKDAIPLEKYIDAKDEFDYKHNNYTTTEFLDATPDEKVREAQQKLNELGYTDKFGEPLKEDGILGAKTLYAKDNYKADAGYRSNAGNVGYNITALSNATQNTSQRFGNRMPITSRSGNNSSIASEKNRTPLLNKESKTTKMSNTYTHKSGVTKWRELPDISERLPKEYKLYKEGKISDEIYKAMDTLSQRWFYADTPGAREEISSLAQSVRNNNYKVIDCTEDANKQLRNNRQEILDFMKESIDEHQMFTLADYAVLGYDWFEKVNVNGIWDYKSMGATWIPEQKYFMYYGQIINDNDFGNINYGYTGTILGLKPETLYKAGGKVNKNPTSYEIDNYYSDSEVDHYWIKKGIEQANEQGHYGEINLPVEVIFNFI